MHGVVHGRAPAYLSDILTAVSSLPARQHLRSAAADLFDLATAGSLARWFAGTLNHVAASPEAAEAAGGWRQFKHGVGTATLQ